VGAKKGQVKEVSSGHALNFLIPKGIAKALSKEDEVRLAISVANKEIAEKERIKKLEEYARKGKGMVFEFYLPVDAKGHPFGSVNKDMIAGEISTRLELGEEKIEARMPKPIKEMGDHQIVIALSHGITFEVSIRLLPQQ